MNTPQEPVAVVTGASSGIGLGVTQALLERGWRVVGTSRTISNSTRDSASLSRHRGYPEDADRRGDHLS